MTADPLTAPDEPEFAEISFKQGVPCAVNGEGMSCLDAVLAMNEIAGRNGYGRLDMIENRLVGVKSRECYEVPGGLAIIEAHKALEDLCLERDVLHSPLKQALDAFLASTQQCLTGTVRLRFYKGTCTVVGRKSDFSLYSKGLATYDEDDTFDHGAAKGFIDLHNLSLKTWSANRREQGVALEAAGMQA